mmetsp:Transcript_5135/g.8637  ORF Transcript_5135/g.8637 Transcript_5135/m.8637 type:complete len:333 (-) Transcript_5135:232-1230(-)
MSALVAPESNPPEGLLKIDPDNPRNPGSLGHPYGCKPCNKYKPERPDDSCKHAATCSFCHGKEHERPKHRGQRGRHALQRRQFLESRGALKPELVDIIDKIYKEPHETMDVIKKLLRDQFEPGSADWDREVALVVQQIGKIGDAAQNSRPDNVRVRKARAEQPPESSQVDLESRCKWYTGTLHLMVRKMWDEQRSEDEKLQDIEKTVNESLKAFKALSEDLETRLGPAGRLEEHVKIVAVNNEWLVEPLKRLVELEAERQSLQVSDILGQEVWDQLKRELPHLIKDAGGDELKEATGRAESLQKMLQIVKEQVEKDKTSILAALERDESESD